MALQRDTLELKPPKKFPIKNVRADLKTLFLKLSEAAVQGALIAPTAGGSLPNAVTAIFGAGEAVHLERPPTELAWRLVRNGLTHALLELLDERQRGRPRYKGDLDHLNSRIEIRIGDSDVSINRNFFKNPTSMALLPALKKNFASWLRLVELPEKEAGSLANRLDSYFACALHNEWRSHREMYEPVHQHFETPFADALQLEADWDRNRLALIKQFEAPVFEETFSLRQIYVHLRGSYHEPITDEQLDRLGDPTHESPTIVADLNQIVQSWLDQPADSRDWVRVISGGPGSGKSSYAKHLAARVADDSRLRVLYIALQYFDMEEKLEDAIGTYLRRSVMFESNPLQQSDFASPQKPLLLIFDGLDELTKPGDFADQETARFVRRLNTALAQWNASSRRVLTLITGRTAAVQSHRHALDLRDPQVLTVLPYTLDATRQEFHGPDDLLKLDQRHDWWRLYAAAKDGEPELIPDVLLSKDFTELTTEPLLNYLVVLSQYHQENASAKRVNRNAIYQKLYDSVVKRRHAGTPLAAPRDISDEEFNRLMETIAVTAWHGDGRAASIAEVERTCPDDLKQALAKFVDQREHGPARLFAAFYFQQASRRPRSENAFEFTHKSFTEYLTARRFVREIGELHDNLGHPRLRYTEDDGLRDWFMLCCHQPVTLDLLRFIRDEVALRKNECVVAWQKSLSKLFFRELTLGFPLFNFEEKHFRTAEAKSKNAEEALLCALNACARCTGTTAGFLSSDVGIRIGTDRLRDARGSDEAGALISRLRGQRWPSSANTALACLNHLDLSGQNLVVQELYKADLHASDLRGVRLIRAELANANLRHADLRDARLREARLGHAELSQANLSRADLSYAELSRARLAGADLNETNLNNADLRGADLSNALNLTQAQLDKAWGDGRTKLPEGLTIRRWRGLRPIHAAYRTPS